MFKILINGNKEIASIEFKIPDKKQNIRIFIELSEENKKRDTAITAEKSFKLKNINKKFLYVVVALVVLIAIYLTK